MTHIVGKQNRSEFILDPAEAWRRGRLLDRTLATTRLGASRGVLRATHRELNRLDDLRALEIARRLNAA